MRKARNIKLTLVAMVLVFGAVTTAVTGGQVSAQATDAEDTADQSVQFNGPKWRYFAELNDLLRDHVAKSTLALKADVHNTPDELVLREAVDQNSALVAQAIEKKYPGTHDEFLMLWRTQSEYYHEYVRAKVQRDSVGQARARSKLNAFSHRVSDLLDENTRKIDQVKLQEQLNIHAQHMMAIIANLASGRDDTANQLTTAEQDFMSDIAKTLARIRW